MTRTSLHQGLKFLLIAFLLGWGCREESGYPAFDRAGLAAHYFQEDAAWYLTNIPFFECSDKEIEQVFYYRWKLYKAHIRSVGRGEYVITEFIHHMDWDREPYCTINAASMHHIYEGRWLADDRYLDGYINNLYQNGGNNLQYSESIADATYARYLVNADSTFLFSQLDSMKSKYDGWSDHWDGAKGLYFIPAMPDATEYNIASIDASGGKDGFAGGDGFRPTINSYMYGNATAISRIAALKGNLEVSREFARKADALKANVERDLWNDSMEHFIDRYKVDNQYVHYWDFIRGRELAGFAPWYFNLPTDTDKYRAAWKHLLDTTRLLGRFGLRTNEPSYQYYFRQFVYNSNGQPGSQWNGPSWPYQSSQAITGMANFLNNYSRGPVTPSDYVHALRQFAKQHYLPNGELNLVENYDPDKGGPIVFFSWSNHYLHSSFNNLVISGLCGIRPSEGDTLTINPLIDPSIAYFRLDEVYYHGHKMTVIFDRDGSRYHSGKGLMVYLDGKKTSVAQKDGKYRVVVGAPVIRPRPDQPVNYALNIRRKGFPALSASVNSAPDSLFQAVDGRIWYFPEVRNRWSTAGSTSASDWLAIDFGEPREITTVKIYLFADNRTFSAPGEFVIEYQAGGDWLAAMITGRSPHVPVGNTVNTVNIGKVSATRLRIRFVHEKKQVAISEVECY